MNDRTYEDYTQDEIDEAVEEHLDGLARESYALDSAASELDGLASDINDFLRKSPTVVMCSWYDDKKEMAQHLLDRLREAESLLDDFMTEMDDAESEFLELLEEGEVEL